MGTKSMQEGTQLQQSKVMYMDKKNVNIKPITQYAAFLKNSMKSKM